MKRIIMMGAALLVLLASACTDNKRYETAACALTDISGTYAEEKENMGKIIKAGILPKLLPGDHFFLISIDSNSYHEDNLISKITLDYRPSQVNNQKLAFAKTLDEFSADKTKSQFTDISGAMMLCRDYLKKTMAGTQVIIIFSDMLEELPAGVIREFTADEFDNIHLAAMNIIKLNKDSADPKIYRDRLADWENRVLASGAKSWNISLEPSSIPDYIDEIRN